MWHFFSVFFLLALLVGCSKSQVDSNASPDLNITTTVDPIDTPDEILQENLNSSQNNSENDVTLGAGLAVVDQIVNIGEKIWNIVQAGKAVANASNNFANALPQGVTSSMALENFSDPQYHSFHVGGTNGLGMKVYDLTYTVVHRYGGDYQGTGKYLDAVTILPSQISVDWGYTLDFSVSNIDTVNVGNSQAPIAAMQIQLNTSVGTVLKKVETNTLYSLRGDSSDITSNNTQSVAGN